MMHSARPVYVLHLTRHRIGLMVGFILALLFMLFLMALLSARTAAAAPLLDGEDSRPWARDAVAALTAAGVVAGYPDNTYKGDRSMTRDEAARVLSTVQAHLAEQDATSASKADLDELTREVESLHDALEAEGVRVDAAGTGVDQTKKRLEHVDRPSL